MTTNESTLNPNDEKRTSRRKESITINDTIGAEILRLFDTGMKANAVAKKVEMPYQATLKYLKTHDRKLVKGRPKRES